MSGAPKLEALGKQKSTGLKKATSAVRDEEGVCYVGTLAASGAVAIIEDEDQTVVDANIKASYQNFDMINDMKEYETRRIDILQDNPHLTLRKLAKQGLGICLQVVELSSSRCLIQKKVLPEYKEDSVDNSSIAWSSSITETSHGVKKRQVRRSK